LAEYDAGTVKATMTADGKGVHAEVEAVKKDFKGLAQDIAKSLHDIVNAEKNASKATKDREKAERDAARAAKQAAQERKEAYRDLGLAAGISFAAITAGIWKATQENNKLKASMMGLDSIAKGTIGTYSKIEAELEKVKNDGMIPLTNATAAYKNLLTRYKDEETAITMFKRLADAAAFGRQGHLGLGEAIQGATEGLKNEMSQLVDNAGVTKNVSQMWKEYAAQIGKTMGQLTAAEKHQAEINGILEETRFQVGDLAKLQNTLSGEMSKANAETNQAAAAYGDALEPALTGVVGGYSAMMKNIREFIQTSPGMVAGITAGALAMTGLVSVTSAWIALDLGAKIAAGFMALTGPIGLTLIGLSALTAVIVGYTTAAQKAREENLKLADRYRDESVEVKDLITEYQELQKVVKPNADQKQRMVDLSNQIAKILPNAISGYDKEGNAIINVNSALREMILLKGTELRLRLKELDIVKMENERKIKKLENDIDTNKKYHQAFLNESKVENSFTELNKQKTLEHAEAVRRLRGEKELLVAENKKIQAEEKAINDLLAKGITPGDIKKPTTIKPTTTTETTPGLTSKEKAAIEKRAEEQLQLDDQLYIEKLERQEKFQKADIERERLRYEKERELAKDNASLIEQIERSHQERLKVINDEYAKQQTQKQADLISDLVLRQKTLKDAWADLMSQMVREYIQNFLLKIKAANSGGNFWMNLFGAISGMGGGAAGSTDLATGATANVAAKGMIVPAATAGMVVPPSFGTDTVPAMLTPKEMVLPRDISEGLQQMIRQGNQPQNVTNNITNNYIDAIDEQSVAQFFYKNRDQVVGIVNDNQRRGGVLRKGTDE
jgi:hypothetical protein